MSFPRQRGEEGEPFECPSPITCQFPRCDCGPPPEDAVRASLRDFIQAFDAGAVEVASADIDLGDGQPPHSWHEEWLWRARRALEGK